jgi:hypothetical protein
MYAIQTAGSGNPGRAMALAPPAVASDGEPEPIRVGGLARAGASTARCPRRATTGDAVGGLHAHGFGYAPEDATSGPAQIGVQCRARTGNPGGR